MKAALVFTPAASPAYTPLGLATLAQYIRSNLEECRLDVIDLNIAAWNYLADNNEAYRLCRNFMQGKLENFYNRNQYSEHLAAWGSMNEDISHFNISARAYLEKDIIDVSLEKLLNLFTQRIFQNSPELIAFSIMYPGQVLFSLAAAKYILQFTSNQDTAKARIVLGGATATALNVDEMLLACPYVDAVYLGEGEIGLKLLCQNADYKDIPGLAYREGGSIVKNRKPDSLSLSEIPQPLFEDFDLKQYFNPEAVLPVIFSRGCKWRKCRFCAHNFSYSGYRRRNITKFVDYLEALIKSKQVRHFYFADQYVDYDDMETLSKEIIARNLDIAFHIMGRPIGYTLDILKTMSKAGCRWISWGVESGSQRLLDICNKGTRAEEVSQIIKDSSKSGISNLLMMIFGLPLGTEQDFNATIDFLDELAEYSDDITSSSFQLFDKTAFANQASTYGLKIRDKEVLFTSPNGALHSLRYFFHEVASDGSTRPPKGSIEVNKFKITKEISGWKTIYENLCCEHYLLYASYFSRKDIFKPNPQTSIEQL